MYVISIKGEKKRCLKDFAIFGFGGKQRISPGFLCLPWYLICTFYAHPEIAQDEFVKEKLCEVVDYIRDNYDLDIFTRV